MSRPRDRLLRQSTDVSVVICAYHEERWADLVAAIAALREQTMPPDEIIVVIDHAPPLLKRACAEFANIPTMRVCENIGQRGLSGSRNSGIHIARGAIIAFLDDDATPANDWLERLCEGYSEPKVMGVGGAIVPRWTSSRPHWFPKEFDWVVGCTYRGMPERRAPIRNLIGANMSLRQDVLRQLGGFFVDMGRVGKLPVGCEETVLCIRARQRWPQGIFIYEPAAKVSHRVPMERASWKYFLSRCIGEGLSKAQVARAVGSAAGLANERAYTLRTLPRGVGRGLTDAFLRRDLSGLARALAIALGLAATSVGYVVGLLWHRSRRVAKSNISQLNPLP